MPRKPCLDCGTLSAEHRCPQHLAEWKARREQARNRGKTTERGYDNRWRKLRSTAIAQQPFCTHCGTTEDLTADHIIPLSAGGTSTENNIQVLCRSCNGRKSDRLNPLR